MVYNADEIFAIGVEIEKNGKAFYDASAKNVENEEMKQFLRGLANWEQKHVELFKKMQSEIPPKLQATYDPYGELQLYIKAAADSHIFIKNKNMEKLAAKCKNIKDILNMAMSFEKDSVVLYSAMRNMVPEDLGQSHVEKLINEELQHISMLKQKLNELS
jgi:rubrerythrin